MPRPLRTIATVDTPEGRLELRQRDAADFLIVIGGRVLMTSTARRSEEALATLALAALPAGARAAPRVLIGGLGMGYTLRAALTAVPAAARVTVAELSAAVVDWCRGPLAPLTDSAVDDPRVRVHLGDVNAAIRTAPPGSLDAIILDLYEGPNASTQNARDPSYGKAALAAAHAALAPGGVLAIWAEEHDETFARRFATAAFDTRVERAGGRGDRRHIIYLGLRRGTSRT